MVYTDLPMDKDPSQFMSNKMLFVLYQTFLIFMALMSYKETTLDVNRCLFRVST